MGTNRFGAPLDEVLLLKDLLSLTTFIEGGTFKGDTSLLMSKHFNKVYTVENSTKMYNIARATLRDIPNVGMFEGDTRLHIEKLMQINNDILFWLDAHWSGGETYGGNDECPLLEELDCIFSQETKNFAILVDDARLFLAPPPKPHNLTQWPTIVEITRALPNDWELMVYEDVMYIFPARIQSKFKTYMQSKITKDWALSCHGSILKKISEKLFK